MINVVEAQLTEESIVQTSPKTEDIVEGDTYFLLSTHLSSSTIISS